MADWSKLGAALGGAGPNPLAYEQGAHLGAETQSAMAQAAERVQKQKALSDLAGALEGAGVNTARAQLMGTAAMGGVGLGDLFGGLQKGQEIDTRTSLADPTLDDTRRNQLLATLANAPIKPFEAVGSKGYADVMHPEKGVIALPGGAQGGGDAAQIQLLRAYGLLDEQGRITNEAKANDVIARFNLTRSVDVGGVPTFVNMNPARGSVGTPLGAALSASVPPAAAPAAPAAAAPGAPAAPAAAPAAAAPPSDLRSAAVQNAAALAGAKEVATTQGKNLAALPGTMDTLNQFEQSIDALTTSKGFDSIYGHVVGSIPGANMVQGIFNQDAANASAFRDNVKAQSFQAAIQKMRGLGQLSNAEGQKVQDAFTVATNPTLDPATARTAWANVKIHLAKLREVAQQESGQQPQAGAPPAPAASPTGAPVQIHSDADYAALPSGSEYIAPDGSRRRKR